jgi:hypothetical protein
MVVCGDNSGPWVAWPGDFAHDSVIRQPIPREIVSSRQRDLFQDDERADLFGDDAPTPEYRADPDQVRQELYRILAEARAAQTMPWDSRRTNLYRTIFPQMTNWLPEDEGTQLRFEFENELARLKAA